MLTENIDQLISPESEIKNDVYMLTSHADGKYLIHLLQRNTIDEVNQTIIKFLSKASLETLQ